MKEKGPDYDRFDNDEEWDFALVSSLNLVICLLLMVRWCQIKHQSAMRRNRLTFKIHLWYFIN